MKIYTRTGDQGGTGLFGGERVSKDDARVCTYGALDEANATLGVCAAAVDLPAEIRTQLHVLMSDLFDVGAELATPAPDEATLRARLGSLVDQARVTALEHAIDAAEAELAPLRTFILPTGTEAAARLHFARTVVRRAEREVVALARAHFVRPVVVMFLNRLSDALFVWARLANARARVPDAPWQKRT
jgi:cob(I)alamin adenosyltransferase